MSLLSCSSFDLYCILSYYYFAMIELIKMDGRWMDNCQRIGIVWPKLKLQSPKSRYSNGQINPLMGTGNYSATLNNMKLAHWPLMGGCYIWYSEEGTGRGRSPPRSLLAVPNVTAHPSTASVPITVLLYSGPLLCGFNVPVKGLKPQSNGPLYSNTVKSNQIKFVSQHKRTVNNK